MTLPLLLVEDDPVEARRLSSALAGLGYEVTIAEDGDAALDHLAARAFDVVLLDLVVPGLDGMGVLQTMAARGIATPVVVQVTAAGLDAASGAIRSGARDFVVKPAGMLRLQVALANAMALGRAAPPAARPGRAETDAVQPDNVVPFTPASGPFAMAPTIRDSAPDAPLPPTLRTDSLAYARLDAAGHARRLEQIEAEAIRFACHLYGGRMAEVARRLGIGRSTLYRKLAELDLDTVGRNRDGEPTAERFVAAE
ncbi:response regulator [Xanthobacter autotrophicus]|uniref:response regulator n=1 Tax=Xanthobacter autotrophicus TaxID=280 RepID=UPI0024A79BCA|nr:response regulator [Xanthobacter autotrophicus]MDI4657847.1 response regulator [Xanthobacter autotrophicus]